MGTEYGGGVLRSLRIEQAVHLSNGAEGGETWEGGENAFRGGSGPLGTEYARTEDPIYEAWIEAAKQAGFDNIPAPPTWPFAMEFSGKFEEMTFKIGRDKKVGLLTQPLHLPPQTNNFA